MNQPQLQKKIQALQNLAANPGTDAEGLAAERAIERLREKLSEIPWFNCQVDHEAIICGPVLTSVMSCRWKDKIFYALSIHMNCVPFITWEDKKGKYKTNRVFKYYIYGNERNAKNVLAIFKSLNLQVQQEIRKNRNTLYRHQYGAFREGIAERILEKLILSNPRGCYSTTTESVKIITEFAAKNHVNYSFVLFPSQHDSHARDPASVEYGKEQAEKLSVDALLAKPKA